MVQVDKRSHLVLFKQNHRNHDPSTSELQKAYKTNYLVNRHNMIGTVSKLYVSNNTWIYVYIKKTWQNFNSNSNSREFQLQFQLQLREFQLQLQLRQVSWISTPTPTPTPGVSTPTPTPASPLNINSNSNSGGFNSNSNSNSGVGVEVEPNSNSNSGVDPNPDWYDAQFYFPSVEDNDTDLPNYSTQNPTLELPNSTHILAEFEKTTATTTTNKQKTTISLFSNSFTPLKDKSTRMTLKTAIVNDNIYLVKKIWK